MMVSLEYIFILMVMKLSYAGKFYSYRFLYCCTWWFHWSIYKDRNWYSIKWYAKATIL